MTRDLPLIVASDTGDEFVDAYPFRLRSTYGGNTTCVEVRCDDKLFILAESVELACAIKTIPAYEGLVLP